MNFNALLGSVIGLLLAGCGGGSSDPVYSFDPVNPVTATALDWRQETDVPVAGSYTPFVVLFDHTIRSYTNSTNGDVDGRWYVRDNDEPYQLALAINDPRDRYVRTSGVTRLPNGSYVALLMTGDGYPTQGGYSPSIATSSNGTTWTWHGTVSPFGRFQSSAGALTASVDGCEAWTDGTGQKLVRMTAPLPCLVWSGDATEVWPMALPDDSPQFCTATRTQYGTHLICANKFPASKHRHLFRARSSTVFCVLETSAPTVGEKGTHLAFDGIRIHAITGGRHRSLEAKDFSC